VRRGSPWSGRNHSLASFEQSTYLLPVPRASTASSDTLSRLQASSSLDALVIEAKKPHGKRARTFFTDPPHSINESRDDFLQTVRRDARAWSLPPPSSVLPPTTTRRRRPRRPRPASSPPRPITPPRRCPKAPKKPFRAAPAPSRPVSSIPRRGVSS